MAKKMKIAFLNMYNGVVDRGAETFVKEVASRLAKSNKVCVFQAGEKRSKDKYEVIRIPVSFNWKKKSGAGTILSRLFIDYWNRLVFVFTLKALPKLWKEKFDIAVPVNGGWMPAFVRLVTWFYGGKMIISGQAGVGWDEANNLWSLPNAFVPLSKEAEKWANKVNPFIKTEVISNGVDLKKFRLEGESFDTDLKKPIVLCVGALTPSKRIELAIKAVSRLENTSLLVVGDGDLKEKIEKMGERLLKDRFQLTKVPFEDMPKVYRACDVFTIPSQSFYAFEIVLVEAMASGLPVVANKDPIRKEIAGDAGFLVNPQDANSYSEVIREALDKDWGDKPRRQAKKFSWDNIANKYKELFRIVLQKERF